MVWSLESFFYALFLGCGIGLLLLAYFVWKNKGSWRDRICWLTSLLGTAGFCMLFYAAFLIAINHKQFFLNVKGAQSDSLTVVATVATLVGVVVALIAIIDTVRNGITEITEAKQDILSQIKEHKALVNSELSLLSLTQQRLALLFQSERDKDAFEFNNDVSKRVFCEHLTTLYADPNIETIMKYFAEHYDRGTHGELRSGEKAYVRAICAHWQKHPGDPSRKKELEQLSEMAQNRL